MTISYLLLDKEGMNDIDKNVLKNQSDNIIFTGKISYNELLNYYKKSKYLCFSN